GPTGVGKTEISPRLAKLAQAPFLKAEAAKFTEVGYVGRDVESIVRDLLEVGIGMVRQEERDKGEGRARGAAEGGLPGILLPARGSSDGAGASESTGATREKLRRLLREGRLDDREVEIAVSGKVCRRSWFRTPQWM